jgi:hypothetical protein
VYSRNKGDSGINGDARDFPDIELDDFLFDGLSDDDEVRSAVPGPAPIKLLGDALLP